MKRVVTVALSWKSKLGFVLGTCEKTRSASLLLLLQQRCNDMATSWLLNILSKENAETAFTLILQKKCRQS